LSLTHIATKHFSNFRTFEYDNIIFGIFSIQDFPKMSQKPGKKIAPIPMSNNVSVVDLIDTYFTAYNSARLREACQLLTKEVFQEGVTVGVSLSGAMTPAGFGVSALAPLIRNGFIDWMICTGANLYHDIHYGLGFELFAGSPFLDDVKLREEGTIRICSPS